MSNGDLAAAIGFPVYFIGVMLTVGIIMRRAPTGIGLMELVALSVLWPPLVVGAIGWWIGGRFKEGGVSFKIWKAD